ENGDFDRAGLGKDFVGMNEESMTIGEIEDGDAEDAIEILVNLVDKSFKFLPEDKWFVVGDALRGRRNLGNCGEGQKQDRQNRVHDQLHGAASLYPGHEKGLIHDENSSTSSRRRERYRGPFDCGLAQRDWWMMAAATVQRVLHAGG